MKEKLIVVRNNKDYIKFIKKLKYYKNIIYFNTFFEVESDIDNDNLKIICEALNIKTRKRRIEYVYDQACNMIDNKVAGINRCGFINNKCHVQRKSDNGKCNGCCRGCLYQTNKGCSTKNLTCKLFNCSEIKKRYETLEYKDLDVLRLLSVKNRLIIKHDYFSTREDVLKDLYSISLFYAVLRMTYRMIKTFIMIRKKDL